MTQTFTFRQQNRNNWESITSKLNAAVFAAKKGFKRDFEIEIRELKKKRSGQ